MAPAKAIEKLRLETAWAIIEEDHAFISRITVVTGFGDEEHMRHVFIRALRQPFKDFVHQARAKRDNVYLN